MNAPQTLLPTIAASIAQTLKLQVADRAAAIVRAREAGLR